MEPQIVISEKDFKIFINTINNPKGPNEELKRAAKEYKEFIKKHES